MNDFSFARSQMGMLLAFHIIFAVIGMAMPLVTPDVTLQNASAPESTLKLLLLALGAVVLFPSLFYLFQIFKGQEQR